jgi:hypothetical protein
VNNGGWVLIVVLGIILILFSLFRRRGGAAKYPEIVQALLFDVKWNQVLADNFPKNDKYRRFAYSNWKMNKDKIGFLGEIVKQMLRESFTLVEEYNKIIREAQKAKSDSHKDIDLTRFKELVAKTRQELEDWMVQKTGSKDLPPKYPTIFGSLFGER